MPADERNLEPRSWTTFGAMLRYLRRRARLTQRDLGIAVGYSEGHINRFEKNKHLPDPATVAALFVPALDLAHEPALAARLIELSAHAPRTALEAGVEAASGVELGIVPEPIPLAAPHEITRTHVLTRLHARLAQDRRVVLCGLPGIGKTTLASHIARDYAGRMPVFWLTLMEGVTTSVDAMVRRVAHFLIGHGHPQVKPLVATDLRGGNRLSLDQQMALIGAALGKQPALLCFDNAELIRNDEACLQMLRHLGTATPAFLLLTTRESLPLASGAEITIDGLECDEGMAFIAQGSHHAIAGEQAARLLDKTAGSPMLLQLALGHLLDDRAAPEAFIGHLESQPQVAAYLLQTIQKQLTPSAWRLLLLLSLFQRPINLYDEYLVELTHALDGIGNIGEAIVELQRRRLVADAKCAHLHPLVRDYGQLALNTQATLRRRLHRLAAEWLQDANQDPLSTARHYARAGLPDQALDMIEENVRVLIGGGQAMSTVVLLDELHARVRRVRSDPGELRRRLLTLRGQLLAGSLRAAEGEADLRQAIELTRNPAVRANIICQLAELTSQRSDFPASLRLIQRARAELAPDDLLLCGRLASLESMAHDAMGNPQEAGRTAKEALAAIDRLAGLPHSITGDIRACAELQLANEARLRRDLIQAMQHAQAALTAARAAHQPRMTNLCLAFVGGLCYDQGDLDASFRYRAEALEGLSAIGDLHSAAYVLTYLADIHFARDEEDQALEKLAQAGETLRIVEDMRGLVAAESLRVSCLLWRGEVQEARRVMEQILKEAYGKGTDKRWAYRLNKLAMVQLVQAETEAAIATLQHAHDLPPVAADPMMHLELHSTWALALTATGDPEAAAAILAEAPRLQGQSRWAGFDRDLIEGYVELARGRREAASQIANQMLESTVPYARYRQSARQLIDAIEQATPTRAFPRLMWCDCAGTGPGDASTAPLTSGENRIR